MIRTLFYGASGALRNGWWILLFYLALGVAVAGLIQLAPQGQVPELWQLGAALAVTALLQTGRRRPWRELSGQPGLVWLHYFGLGTLLAAALWGMPTLFLLLLGATRMTCDGPLSTLVAGLLALMSATVLEEVVFRGFVFRRLQDGLGPATAVLLSAGHFLLVHMNNPGMHGVTHVLAMANIFIAGLAFGLAALRSGGLALPIGLHLGANWLQGPLLGFGVSGHATEHLCRQQLNGPDWLTGGAFGLEASVPGTLAIMAVAWLLWRWRPAQQHDGKK
ncbi:CPBP family intramembrane glutamic endopeptidase [Massilia sp. SM-13]|uniref:CPBP family intramembrane glutamic endopeptidase n=1 Tax=Pseudoduganella rhizocola TaxID=3382643 RepID=UPI0038B6A1E7